MLACVAGGRWPAPTAAQTTGGAEPRGDAQPGGETPPAERPRPAGEAPSTGESAASWWSELGFKGALIYKNFSFFQESPAGDEQFRNEGIFRLEWQRRLAAWAHIKAVVEARGDDADLTDGVYFQIPETERRRSILDRKSTRLNSSHLGISY